MAHLRKYFILIVPMRRIPLHTLNHVDVNTIENATTTQLHLYVRQAKSLLVLRAIPNLMLKLILKFWNGHYGKT